MKGGARNISQGMSSNGFSGGHKCADESEGAPAARVLVLGPALLPLGWGWALSAPDTCASGSRGAVSSLCIAEQGRVRAWGAVVRGEVVCCGALQNREGSGPGALWCEGRWCVVV